MSPVFLFLFLAYISDLAVLETDATKMIRIALNLNKTHPKPKKNE